MPGIKKLIFVDANILLDFYRARTEAGLALLEHLENIAGRVIVSYQLEMEFKKNRQAAIGEGLGALRPQEGMSRPGLFSNAAAIKAIRAGQKAAEKRITKLRARYLKALQDPAKHDPVYKICQRLFHKGDSLVLRITDPKRHVIRRKALRRFMLGCPPRKKGDTSLGDAVNWESMKDRADAHNAELVIVSRDSDYGMTHGSQSFVNDHLKQEFSERVSKKRKILLYTKLSEALKHFQVSISEKERQEEEAIVQEPREPTGLRGMFTAMGSTAETEAFLKQLYEAAANARTIGNLAAAAAKDDEETTRLAQAVAQRLKGDAVTAATIAAAAAATTENPPGEKHEDSAKDN